MTSVGSLPDAIREARPSVLAIYCTLRLVDEDPTIAELVEITGLSRKTVTDALDDLEAARVVGSRTTSGRGQPRRYWALEPV